jgi:integrase
MRRQIMPRGSAVIRYDGARGTVWRVKYADASGRQIQETIGAERDGVTRKMAEAELRERLVRVERKSYRRPKALTFEQFAETWYAEGQHSRGWKPATLKVYRNALNAYLIPAFGPTRLDGIRPRDVAAFIRDATTRPQGKFDRPLSAKFVNLLLNVTHAIYDKAIGEELVQTNPIVGVQRPKVQRRRWRVLEPVEVARVLKALEDERARTVFLTLTLTGIRRFELQSLRWEHINLLDATLRVRESKTEEGERLIALSPALADALAAHYAKTTFKADENYVFGHPERGSKLDAEWYAGEFRKALAGIAGHRSMATTKQYVHLAGVVFRDEAAMLEQRLLGVEDSGRNSRVAATLSENA